MKNNRNNNYFVENITRFGDDFLKQKTAKNLDMDAIRIFRDLARGKIDPEKYGRYFLDNTFLDALIRKADEKFAFFDISFRGVSMLPDRNNSYVMSTLEQHSRSSQAYKILLDNLIGIQKTKNYKYLYSLVSQIKQYRYDL